MIYVFWWQIIYIFHQEKGSVTIVKVVMVMTDDLNFENCICGNNHQMDMGSTKTTYLIR